jgi:hypothetical protein
MLIACLICLLLLSVIAYMVFFNKQQTTSPPTQPQSYKPKSLKWNVNSVQPYEDPNIVYDSADNVQKNNWVPPSTIISSYNAECGWSIANENFHLNARKPC